MGLGLWSPRTLSLRVNDPSKIAQFPGLANLVIRSEGIDRSSILS